MRSGAEPVRIAHHRTRLIFFGLQFAFILAVGCADIFDLIATGATILPRATEDFGKKAHALLAAGIARQSPTWNPLRPEVRAYLNWAGIEAGYSFFAPNVPKSFKVVIELHYPDERVEYDLLSGEAGETDLRFSSQIDQIGETTFAPMREVLMKVLAYSVWEFHPDATSVRAILGARPFQSLVDFKAGKKADLEFIEAYDFSFAQNNPP